MPNVASPHLPQHSKGLMEPPKVDVSLGGCIVVPTASPQPRSQVLQAGLPVPAYEASLVSAEGFNIRLFLDFLCLQTCSLTVLLVYTNTK
jgi:hypothetical protein